MTAPRPEPARPDAPAGAARLAFLLLALALPWTIAPMSIATGLCAALTVWQWSRSREGRLPATPVNRPAVAWVLALLLAAIFSIDREASLPRVTKAFFPFLVPLAAYHATDRTTGLRALGALLLSAAIAAALGLGWFIADGATFAHRARGAVGHYMTFAGQLMMFACLAFGVALAHRGRWRIAAATSGALAVVALAATYTRSAWLGLAAGAIAMTGARRPRWLPAIGLALVAIVLVAPGAMRERLASGFDPRHPTNVQRTHMWSAGLRMFAEYPLTGVGLMDLKPVYERYRAPGATEPAGHLHSVPIHLLATTGVLGVAAFLWLVSGWFRTAWRRRETASTLATGLRLGVLGALVAFLVSGLFEWNLGDEELLYPLYVMLGIAWGARAWAAAPPAREAPVESDGERP